jgi:hypothetical protein
VGEFRALWTAGRADGPDSWYRRTLEIMEGKRIDMENSKVDIVQFVVVAASGNLDLSTIKVRS